MNWSGRSTDCLGAANDNINMWDFFVCLFVKLQYFHCVCTLLHSAHTYLSSLDLDLAHLVFIRLKKVCPQCNAVFSVRKLRLRLLG